MSKLNISNIKLGGSTQQVKNFFTSGSAVSKVVIAIIFIVVVLVIVQVIKAIFGGIHNYRYNRIWIENGKTLCPKTSVVVPGHLLHRSKNELGGAEFTYSFWMQSENYASTQSLLSRRSGCNNNGYFNMYVTSNKLYFGYYTNSSDSASHYSNSILAFIPQV